MRRPFRNTLAVLVTTAITALVVYVGVSLVTGSSAMSADSVGGTTQTCPRTGCSASSCHATQGLSPQQAYGSSGDGGFGGDRNAGSMFGG